MCNQLSYNSQAAQVKDVLKSEALSTHSVTHLFRKAGAKSFEIRGWGSGATEQDLQKLGGWDVGVCQLAYANNVPWKGECVWLWVQLDTVGLFYFILFYFTNSFFPEPTPIPPSPSLPSPLAALVQGGHLGEDSVNTAGTALKHVFKLMGRDEGGVKAQVPDELIMQTKLG